MKGSSEHLIKKARVQLILDSPFFGNLVMNLKISKQDRLPFGTMAVDDVGNLYYDDGWVSGLTPAELEFVLCHEVLHLAFKHLTRREGRQVMRWFMAADLAINSVLVSTGIGQMPTDKKTGERMGLYSDKYDGWSAERIYNDLPEQKECSGDCSNCDGGVGMKGKGKFKCPIAGKEKGDGEGEGEGGGEMGDGWYSGGGFDDHKDGSTSKSHSEQQRRDLEEQWKNAVARAANSARMQGKLPGGLKQLIDGLLNPKVDWRTVLWQFVNKLSKDDYRWYPPNRRHIHNGLYLPSMRSETFEIAVAMDTSGSISDQEAKQFLSEVRAILEMNPSCTLHFFQCDADVHVYKEYHAGEDIDFEIHGRGGTDFRPVFDKIEELGLEIPCLVYLTDMYGTFPDYAPQYEVLWIATTDQKAPWGEVVRMETGEKR